MFFFLFFFLTFYTLNKTKKKIFLRSQSQNAVLCELSHLTAHLGKEYQANVFSYFSNKNILRVHGASNVYPQHIFSWWNKKKYQYISVEKKK